MKDINIIEGRRITFLTRPRQFLLKTLRCCSGPIHHFDANIVPSHITRRQSLGGALPRNFLINILAGVVEKYFYSVFLNRGFFN